MLGTWKFHFQLALLQNTVTIILHIPNTDHRTKKKGIDDNMFDLKKLNIMRKFSILRCL